MEICHDEWVMEARLGQGQSPSPIPYSYSTAGTLFETFYVKITMLVVVIEWLRDDSQTHKFRAPMNIDSSSAINKFETSY